MKECYWIEADVFQDERKIMLVGTDYYDCFDSLEEAIDRANHIIATEDEHLYVCRNFYIYKTTVSDDGEYIDIKGPEKTYGPRFKMNAIEWEEQ